MAYYYKQMTRRERPIMCMKGSEYDFTGGYKALRDVLNGI